jgi:serine phosphatase RsbU (regulator of sigma subunit)
VSAGHPPPFLNDQELSVSGALPLGLTLDVTYEDKNFELRTGDRLALYTDGLVEARNAAGELYGFTRLKGLLATSPSAQRAADVAREFGQDDDVTVLTLTRVGMSQEAGFGHPATAAVPA